MNIPQISIIFLKPGESMPVLQEVCLIDVDKYYMLAPVPNAEAVGAEGVHSNLNLMEWFGF
jgi:hypothetical protein